MSINFNELRELLGAIAQTDIEEVTLKTDTFELKIRRGGNVTPSLPSIATPAPVVVTPTTPPPSVITATPVEPPTPSPVEKKWVAITSPMVGTFYRAPAPDEAAFVEVGDRIGNGQTVCIIEAMKLMNEIEAEVTGQIMEIVVANGEPVEYGQTLMWANPS
ncbi:acetyl-CoA carboxylase biotin carboxyl carrier protein [Aphanothece sacrum]|uniref:Biotin carboxyl carrier protein of acetyl-CoA carboxylase n=1 Tax=Aphanothece sacrum FPU1 TaxID=1920663 RepID=A0A401IE96_APHSA|nr:acetyl-CoA carboxylase biotin carboxyl carrier protein [Aphanothece sacrum]GBF79556.1 acetyl-CoA carboxylase, biotin carboxyl carrier protein [Aphanothece sacrum FPU1]GBF86280.1 acetyl-CoA carboxylase, biotin carboxyl carrier protein [Aphanothece sacrum FPU3]